MRALVTGATGFLGGALTRRLHTLGWQVTALGRNLVKLKELQSLGVQTRQIDLFDSDSLAEACTRQEIVFHCAALPAPWRAYSRFYRTNVIGTRHVVEACEASNVARLVHVSTPSLYFGYRSRIGVKETDPLPEPISHYAATKRLAEAEIDKGFARGLATISIRPRALFGPGDTVIFPRLIPRLHQGNLPQIGDGENVIDLTYIDNVVDALILCAESPAKSLGKKYNISNGEPVKIWSLIERICRELGLPLPTRTVSYRVADAAATVVELLYRMIPNQLEPPITRLSVSLLAHSTTLDISAARSELGYQPKVSVDEGVELFLKWWKASKLLGTSQARRSSVNSSQLRQNKETADHGDSGL
jgi:nucleoside-diphosphate-sugar epimerase